jgi:hypothetical protein
MAKSSDDSGTVLHCWVSPRFAAEVRRLADEDQRSVSSLIRVALHGYAASDEQLGRREARSPSFSAPASAESTRVDVAGDGRES